MRLKSLELHGYKTFANQTLFQFAEKVTAIVGPNGSGKSNIADSLRWVLGEQSYSLLRGKKTEDMIFTGSQQRPRAGMASATITFDNQDSWLPVDYTEVAVSRRAYRDGDNEYLINSQRVRLKDVSELLAQSGLSERTYTIIGQGLVDAALALRAEERRRLFEEAAGIGLHRSRKEEALRRLDATQRNMERVEDILAELEPRLASLEKQARRAKEYEQIKADLRVALREWYGYHWHLLQKDLGEARENAREKEHELENVQAKFDRLEAVIASRREQVAGLRQILNEWHRQSSQMHTQRELKSRELAVIEERILGLEEQKQGNADEIARLEEENEVACQRLTDVQKDAQRLEGEVQEANQQVALATESFLQQQDLKIRAEKAFQEAQQALAGLSARLGQVRVQGSEKQSQVQRAAGLLQSSAREIEQAEQAVKKYEGALQHNESELEKISKEYQEALNATRALQARLATAEKDLKKLKEQRESWLTEKARLNVQVGVIDQAENSLAGYGNGTRLLVEASRRKRLNGILGALTHKLEVPEQFELAVTAVLGEFLDAIILEDEPGPALDLLGAEAARGILLPLKNLKPQKLPDTVINGLGHATSSSNLEGVFGFAIDYVVTSQDFRPVAELLLGQVLLVQDRLAALHVIKAIESDHPGNDLYSLKIVTLKGEVYFANGPIQSAGAGGKASNQTLLSRSRQKKEFEAKVQKINQELDELALDLQRSEDELNLLKSSLKDCQSAEKEKLKEREKAFRAIHEIKAQLEKSRWQTTWLVDQNKRLQGEIQAGNLAVADLQASLTQLEVEISRSESQVKEKARLYSAIDLNDVQTQLGYWKTQAAVAQNALQSLRERLAESQNHMASTTHSIEAIQRRIEQNAHLQDELHTSRTDLIQAEEQVNQEIERLKILIDPKETELAGLEQEQENLLSQESIAHQSLSLAEHQHAQARILQVRRQESLDNLRRRIEEDVSSFSGLVDFDYESDISGPTPLPLDGMVEKLPRVEQLSAEVEETIKRQRALLRRIGPINPEALAEYHEVKQRFEFMKDQLSDLQRAEDDVRQVIGELDLQMQHEFRKTFDAVAVEFKQIFARLFLGGSARLILTEPEDLTETGIDIEARLPGRRTQGLSLLSGGERALTATALIFALLRIAPTPFCVLDEVDAMLDEANVGRFCDLLRELSQQIQFVVVTHNRNTVQIADVIYGITMGQDSTSQVLSLKLEEAVSLAARSQD